MRDEKQIERKQAKDPFDRVIKLRGHFKATLYDRDGNYKTHVERKNVITTNGLEWLASFIHSASTSASFTMHYMAIGTNSTAETNSDTALGTEDARHTGTVSYTSGGIFNVVATFAPGS